MFSYDELVKGYKEGKCFGKYHGFSVYSAPRRDLKRIGNKDSNYYIIFDDDERYLFFKGQYVGTVDADGDVTEFKASRRFVPSCLLEKKEKPVEMELTDFDCQMELNNIIDAVGKMLDKACNWGE